jgi:hypothetical protein
MGSVLVPVGAVWGGGQRPVPDHEEVLGGGACERTGPTDWQPARPTNTILTERRFMRERWGHKLFAARGGSKRVVERGAYERP